MDVLIVQFKTGRKIIVVGRHDEGSAITRSEEGGWSLGLVLTSANSSATTSSSYCKCRQWRKVPLERVKGY